jgi:hypothetical protein
MFFSYIFDRLRMKTIDHLKKHLDGYRNGTKLFPSYKELSELCELEKHEQTLNALKDGIIFCIHAPNSTKLHRDKKILNRFQERIHAAIKELEEIPTEDVK